MNRVVLTIEPAGGVDGGDLAGRAGTFDPSHFAKEFRSSHGLSGGSEPAAEVNPVAVQAMAEVGIDISAETPRAWADEVVRAADVVTMGCGDTCPYFPGTRYEDWPLEDPAGQDL